jgi:RNA polymerase sigma-70 factor (ECF subfamily)
VAAPLRAGIEAAASAATASSSDPDVALMLRVQAGDQGAYRELFTKFAPRILQYTRRLVGSEARAEEVTQDVFVQVFRFRERYRPEARFATWLDMIATTSAWRAPPAGACRRSVGRRDGTDDGPPLPAAGRRSRPRSHSRLARDLRRRSPRCRKAAGGLLLAHGQPRVSRRRETLGISQGAVKALLFRPPRVESQLKAHVGRR